MKTQIAKLLAELYVLDPELIKKESELTVILTEMLNNKPDTHFDENFRKELKSKLYAEMKRMKYHTSSRINWKSIIAGFLAWGSAIGFASYFVLQSFTPLSLQTDSNTSAPVGSVRTQTTDSIPVLVTNPIDFGFKVEKKASTAFGTLALAPDTDSKGARNTERRGTSSDATNMMATMASPSTASITPSAATSNMTPPSVKNTSTAEGKMIGESRMMIMPPQIYSYEYAGSGYALKNDRMEVLKKKKNAISLAETDAFLKNFKISSLDLAQFSKLKLNNLTMSEDQEYGLSLSVDFNEGTLNLSRNWNLWPQTKCADGKCQIIQIDEIPSDETAIGIARDFLKKYQIATDSYGKPYVNNDWKIQYSLASDKQFAYVPESVTVIYPLILDGKTVYEEYGQTKGMTVTIDIKSGRVSDVYGMEKLDFESSEYEVQTDFSKILEVAKNGGRGRYAMPYMENQEVAPIKVPLGEPEIIYAHLYDYQGRTSTEYLVPALKFPVLREPKEGEYFQTTVIVPIIKEFTEIKDTPIMYKTETMR